MADCCCDFVLSRVVRRQPLLCLPLLSVSNPAPVFYACVAPISRARVWHRYSWRALRASPHCAGARDQAGLQHVLPDGCSYSVRPFHDTTPIAAMRPACRPGNARNAVAIAAIAANTQADRKT